MSKTDDIWLTKDGRELTLDEMAGPHIQNARVVISKWAKGEQDPELKRELKSWTKRFGRELRQRAKAWRKKHG